jgi:lysine-ketoglutarate reductase/saccharopine dehydrogenase-like protein (TIGR00300 family)
MAAAMVSETVDAEGHLIDSGDLQAILTTIVDQGASYEILQFDMGRTNASPSRLSLRLSTETREGLDHLLATLSTFGCYVQGAPDAILRTNDIDGAAPEDFYSTTNHRTQILLNGEWTAVTNQRMDAAIVVDGTTPTCRKLRSLKAGDRVVCGMQGIRVRPDLQGRDKPTFGFMSNDVSSERRVEVAVGRVAEMLRQSRANGERIAFVAGPVVVHTGGGEYFCELVRLGYVDVVLSGNALAVHDIEAALSGTSLGIDLDTGRPVEHGHRNHMRAINAVRRAGGIARAVQTGLLTRGVMYHLHLHGVPYVLAGSIRDDGPLPETVMDLSAAQDQYAEALTGVGVVIMLSSMLHSIGVGNMVPSWVKVVSVDINPAVVTKLSDRGSTQTVGVVTDVGLFLHQLAVALRGSDTDVHDAH